MKRTVFALFFVLVLTFTGISANAECAFSVIAVSSQSEGLQAQIEEAKKQIEILQKNLDAQNALEDEEQNPRAIIQLETELEEYTTKLQCLVDESEALKQHQAMIASAVPVAKPYKKLRISRKSLEAELEATRQLYRRQKQERQSDLVEKTQERIRELKEQIAQAPEMADEQSESKPLALSYTEKQILRESHLQLDDGYIHGAVQPNAIANPVAQIEIDMIAAVKPVVQESPMQTSLQPATPMTPTKTQTKTEMKAGIFQKLMDRTFIGGTIDVASVEGAGNAAATTFVSFHTIPTKRLIITPGYQATAVFNNGKVPNFRVDFPFVTVFPNKTFGGFLLGGGGGLFRAAFAGDNNDVLEPAVNFIAKKDLFTLEVIAPIGKKLRGSVVVAAGLTFNGSQVKNGFKKLFGR